MVRKSGVTGKGKAEAEKPAIIPAEEVKAPEPVKKPRKKQPSQKGLPQKRPIKGVKPVSPDLPKEPPEPEATEQQIAEALEAGISPFQLLLVETYLTCFNGQKAYLYLKPDVKASTAAVESSKILKQPRVSAYFHKRLAAAARRTEEAQDRVLTHYQMLAFGDVSELSEYRRECCRYCYGINHEYQYTASELKVAKRDHEKEQFDKRMQAAALGVPYDEVPFEEGGGTGFNPRHDPVEECPECHGEGRGREVLKDTRKLSPAGEALFDGVEVTKDGIKIKHRNRDAALRDYAKIVKLYDDTSKVNVNFDAETLEGLFGDKMRKARERTKNMLAGRMDEINGSEDNA